MDLKNKTMDKANIVNPVVYYETRFRTPLRAERAIGLWVDRLGSSHQLGDPILISRD
jgi:hypothetical protein